MSGGPGMVIGNMPPPLVPLNLTTTFTPPASCLAPTYTLQGQPKDTFSPPNLNEWATLERGYRSECFPSSLNSFGSSITDEGYITSYYSPGVCPASYVATALSVYGGYRTFATCCPASGSFTANGTICVGAGYDMVLVSGSVTSTASLATLLALAIPIAYQSSDLSLFSTTASTASQTATPGASASLLSPSATSQPPPSGLPAGEAAGIGVGVSLGVIILISIALFFWMRRRKRRQTPQEQSDDFSGKPELDGEGRSLAELHSKDRPRQELAAWNMYEADGVQKPGELGSGDMPAELEGTWRGWEVPTAER